MYRHDSIQQTKNEYNQMLNYTRSEQTTTKLVVRDIDEVRNTLIKKLPTRGKKEIFCDPLLICGTQVYATRCNLRDEEEKTNSSATVHVSERNSKFIPIQDVNPSKTNYIHAKDLLSALKDRQKIDFKIRKENTIKLKRGFGSLLMWTSSNNPKDEGEIISAKVSNGSAKKLYNETALLDTKVQPGGYHIREFHIHIIFVTYISSLFSCFLLLL